jgi:hypothetical protein
LTGQQQRERSRQQQQGQKRMRTIRRMALKKREEGLW